MGIRIKYEPSPGLLGLASFGIGAQRRQRYEAEKAGELMQRQLESQQRYAQERAGQYRDQAFRREIFGQEQAAINARESQHLAFQAKQHANDQAFELGMQVPFPELLDGGGYSGGGLPSLPGPPAVGRFGQLAQQAPGRTSGGLPRFQAFGDTSSIADNAGGPLGVNGVPNNGGTGNAALDSLYARQRELIQAKQNAPFEERERDYYDAMETGYLKGDYEFTSPEGLKQWNKVNAERAKIETDTEGDARAREQARAKNEAQRRGLLRLLKPSFRQERMQEDRQRETEEAAKLRAQEANQKATTARGQKLADAETARKQKEIDAQQARTWKQQDYERNWQDKFATEEARLWDQLENETDEEGNPKYTEQQIAQRVQKWKSRVMSSRGNAGGGAPTTQANVISPDGKYRWDGSKWVPR
jgi:hypothetical protein